YGMGSSLWRAQSERLAGWGSLCLAPTWPLGAHTEPMNPGAEQTMEGIAALVSEFLDALGLDDVVLVGNDTGGAIAQIVVTTAPARVGALVLTSCDAFEHFPPPILRPLITAAKLGPLFTAAMAPMRTRAGRRMAYGALAHADIEDLVREWVGPAQTDSRVRDDLRRFTASLNTDTTIKAAERLPRFTKPALIAWSADDAFFALEDGRRLAQVLPNARFELIERARTFSMIDQPDVLAELIAELADGTGEPARSQRPDALPAQNAA
ncbi:MAG: alpha/beta hydrolase, partial [Solirubrobacterales bacterium]|nr:alpha/beta hydrolase [Solirubrobacterales bacterium]